MISFHHAVFPSIISEIECSCFDLIQESLIEWIYNYQKNDLGTEKSNRGGWQSQLNFFEYESFEKYYHYILQSCSSQINFYNCNFKLSNMWININKFGDYNLLHCHPMSVLSGVLWIKTPDNCGVLSFHSPNAFSEGQLLGNVNSDVRNEKNYVSHLSFNPSAGKMIIFPSHLYHYVESNKSDEDRISIAFNLNI